jgi:enoyl-CoA hydratase
VQIGLPVPVLAMELARDRIVPAALAKATLEARIYGPEEAVRVGYLDEIVEPESVLARAKDEAKRLGGLSRPAFAATKARLRGRTIAYIRDTLDEDMRTLLVGS